MTIFRTWRAVLALIGLSLGLTMMSASVQAEPTEGDNFHDKLMHLGTGPESGSFGAIGDTLCETLNAVRKTTLVRCIPLRSAGSSFNIQAVANGSLQLGMGQEDLVAQAYTDTTSKTGGTLRAVALLHNSPIAIMVRKASGITTLAQIRQGVVNIGNKGAGYYANALMVMKAMDLRETDLAGATYLQSTDFIRAFCEGKVDVIFNALAHPSAQYRQLRACGGEFLDIPPDIIQKIMTVSRWLTPMTIPAGMYDAQQGEVSTVGMRNLLVTNAGVDDEAIFRVATLLRAQHTKLKTTQSDLSSMVMLDKTQVNTLGVPLHSGALRAIQRSKP